MYAIPWIALAINALVHMRAAILHVQDGEDRVRAGVCSRRQVCCTWKDDDGDLEGVWHVIGWTLISPFRTIGSVVKFLMFPRGIKSKFAREREEATKAAMLHKQHQEALSLVQSWAPGEILLAPPPLPKEQVALPWDAAADAFDAAADLVAHTKGQPWWPQPSRVPIDRSQVEETA